MANISFHHQNSPVHSASSKMLSSGHHFQPTHHLFESSATSVSSSASSGLHHSSVVRTINLSGQSSSPSSNVSLVYDTSNTSGKPLFAKRIINGQGSLPATSGSRASNVITLSHISKSAATPISNNVLIIKTEPGNGTLSANGMLTTAATRKLLAASHHHHRLNSPIKSESTTTDSAGKLSQPIIIYSKLNAANPISSLVSAASLPTSTLTSSSTVVNGASNKKAKKQTPKSVSTKPHLNNAKSIQNSLSTNSPVTVVTTLTTNGTGFGTHNQSQNKPFCPQAPVPTTTTDTSACKTASKLGLSTSLSSFGGCLKSNIENCLPTESNKMIFSIASVSPHLPDDIFDSDEEEEVVEAQLIKKPSPDTLVKSEPAMVKVEDIHSKCPSNQLTSIPVKPSSPVATSKQSANQNVAPTIDSHSVIEVKCEDSGPEIVLLTDVPINNKRTRQPTVLRSQQPPQQQVVRLSQLSQLTNMDHKSTKSIGTIAGSATTGSLCNFRANDITFRCSSSSSSSTPVTSTILSDSVSQQQQPNRTRLASIKPEVSSTSSITPISSLTSSPSQEVAGQFCTLVTSQAISATPKTTNCVPTEHSRLSTVKHVIAHVVKPSAVPSVLPTSANIVKVIKKSSLSVSSVPSTPLSSTPSNTVMSCRPHTPPFTSSQSSHTLQAPTPSANSSKPKSAPSVNVRRRREAFIQKRKQIWLSLIKEILPRRERLLNRSQEHQAKRRLLANQCRLKLLGLAANAVNSAVLTAPATTTTTTTSSSSTAVTMAKPTVPKRSRPLKTSSCPGSVPAKKAKCPTIPVTTSTATVLSHSVGNGLASLSTAIKVTVIPNNLVPAKRKLTM